MESDRDHENLGRFMAIKQFVRLFLFCRLKLVQHSIGHSINVRSFLQNVDRFCSSRTPFHKLLSGFGMLVSANCVDDNGAF